MITAERLACEVGDKYNLTYRCKVNLEGTINNMFHFGLDVLQIVDIIDDIYSHIEFVED
jgi:hypothetical protein